ncbi:SH3 domain-containing protein [Vagococcus fluvialis]|uniref:SH3 domain-containing protein n=1 Tax=Vagococcus fluvialis TaxID=2738 RepID=UPI002B27FCB8|nr:SH3 domain-containing protein [Vagococcus fluvialis]
MKKYNKYLYSVLIVIGMLVPGLAQAYEMEYNHNIPGNLTGYATPNFVVGHESGNGNNVGPNSLENEVSYMTRYPNYLNANVTHWVGSGGRVIQIQAPGKVSWGAGANANWQSYAQVELARTNNYETFQKDYASYVNLLRDLAGKGGIPKTLDEGGRGIKTHRWISWNLGGTDHTDPYGYLKSWGVSEAKFKSDIKNGISGVTPKPNPVPTNPTVKPDGSAAIPSKGDTVNFTGTKDIYGTNLWVSNPYQVKEISGNRAVLTKNGGIFAAVNVKDLKVVSSTKPTTPKPTTPNSNGTYSGFTKETAKFTVTVNEGVQARVNGYGLNAKKGGVIQRNQAINYDGWAARDGYIWVHYKGYSGDDLFIPVRPINQNAWGTFK